MSSDKSRFTSCSMSNAGISTVITERSAFKITSSEGFVSFFSSPGVHIFGALACPGNYYPIIPVFGFLKFYFGANKGTDACLFDCVVVYLGEYVPKSVFVEF